MEIKYVEEIMIEDSPWKPCKTN